MSQAQRRPDQFSFGIPDAPVRRKNRLRSLPGRPLVVASALLALVAIFIFAPPVGAHAVLVDSSPAANGTVAGPDISIRLRYNVRVDATRSRLSLVSPDSAAHPLKIAKQTSADTLSSQATGLKPGAYTIRWQVLASDGHITRGEVPFTVREA